MGVSLKQNCVGLHSLLHNLALVILDTWVSISCCKIKSLPVSMSASSNSIWACWQSFLIVLTRD